MNKNLSIVATIAGILLTFPGIAFAREKEAGEAAKLASSAGIVVEKKIDQRTKILEQYLISINSPMAAQAKVFVREADKNDLDWRLVPAIAGLESSFGKRVPKGSYNPFGWGVFTGKSSGIEFQDWEDAIATVSQGLKEKYIDDGLTTIEAIGYRYAASPTWAQRVRFIMAKFETVQENRNLALEMTL